MGFDIFGYDFFAQPDVVNNVDSAVVKQGRPPGVQFVEQSVGVSICRRFRYSVSHFLSLTLSRLKVVKGDTIAVQPPGVPPQMPRLNRNKSKCILPLRRLAQSLSTWQVVARQLAKF